MRTPRIMTSMLALSLALPGLALAQTTTTTTPEATQPPPASAAPAPDMTTTPGGAATGTTGMGAPMGAGTAADTVAPPATTGTAADTAAPPMTTGPGVGTATATDTVPPAWYASMQSDEIIGQNLYGPNGEEIGEIENVVINQQGKQASALIGVGGFLGIGEREVAIPLDEISRGDNNRLTTSMTKDAIGNLPEYQEGGDWAPLGTGRTIGEGVGQ